MRHCRTQAVLGLSCSTGLKNGSAYLHMKPGISLCSSPTSQKPRRSRSDIILSKGGKIRPQLVYRTATGTSMSDCSIRSVSHIPHPTRRALAVGRPDPLAYYSSHLKSLCNLLEPCFRTPGPISGWRTTRWCWCFTVTSCAFTEPPKEPTPGLRHCGQRPSRSRDQKYWDGCFSRHS